MQHRLYGLRGSAYVSKYKQLYFELEENIKEDFRNIIAETGKFSPKDFGSLAVKYLLPLTALDDFMSSYGLIPTGTLDRLKNSINKDTGKKFRAKDIGVE